LALQRRFEATEIDGDQIIGLAIDREIIAGERDFRAFERRFEIAG
jgi:hypothetical protein